MSKEKPNNENILNLFSLLGGVGGFITMITNLNEFRITENTKYIILGIFLIVLSFIVRKYRKKINEWIYTLRPSYMVLFGIFLLVIILLTVSGNNTKNEKENEIRKKELVEKINSLARKKNQNELYTDMLDYFNSDAIVEKKWNINNRKSIQSIEDYLYDLNIIEVKDSIIILNNYIFDKHEKNSILIVKHEEND